MCGYSNLFCVLEFLQVLISHFCPSLQHLLHFSLESVRDTQVASKNVREAVISPDGLYTEHDWVAVPAQDVRVLVNHGYCC